MRTIGQHREAVQALVEPVLPGGHGAGPGSGSGSASVETVSVVDLAVASGAGRGYRVLAKAVPAPTPLPAFDNSQMDGFAVRAADAGTTLRVGAPIPAGFVPPPLEPGTAAPIMTGARVPAGADAVFPVESTPAGSFPAALDTESVPVPHDLVAGTFVRVAGSDLRAGASIARAGQPLTPAVLGALAGAGVAAVDVFRRPRVLVVSTGSELLDDDAAGVRAGVRAAVDLSAGAVIGDANGVALSAALTEVGVETRRVRVPDDPERFVDELDRAVGEWADLVLTTGGISAGAYEVVRQALEPRGLEVTPVAMQPGGPQALGSVTIAGRSVPVVAFPGNPVSALVSFEVFLRPVLARAAGLPGARPSTDVPSADSATSPAGKHQVRRGTIVDGRVQFVGGPSSHLLWHYAEATHLVHVPVGTSQVDAGDVLTVWSIR
ncbi:gephyrin-like molybdotransferase Glp [Curtobacterium sp. MCPF17_031]|uniref:molybdopterin molybdotransferase MoeA n=1 Tax=Curtobacterium sp. MCPF17_031 TaxID=2175653 RepID=UPI000DA8499C|nr:gephyrin-like molybdotransferase Glp [Curtobacterium sp. MCPF17_031]PZE38559.1 molybdopterin molybdenumtransferase MoeA [Curtobacterium sp. MCPF17_031]